MRVEVMFAGWCEGKAKQVMLDGEVQRVADCGLRVVVLSGKANGRRGRFVSRLKLARTPGMQNAVSDASGQSLRALVQKKDKENTFPV